jgi:hypothetical protein
LRWPPFENGALTAKKQKPPFGAVFFYGSLAVMICNWLSRAKPITKSQAMTWDDRISVWTMTHFCPSKVLGTHHGE